MPSKQAFHCFQWTSLREVCLYLGVFPIRWIGSSSQHGTSDCLACRFHPSQAMEVPDVAYCATCVKEFLLSFRAQLGNLVLRS
jgi:hypothetical protein